MNKQSVWESQFIASIETALGHRSIITAKQGAILQKIYRESTERKEKPSSLKLSNKTYGLTRKRSRY